MYRFLCLLGASLPGWGALTVSTDFEGGSGQVSVISDTQVRCELRGETDQDGRNRQPSWFYFRVDGAGGEVTVDLAGFRGEYNYHPTDGQWGRHVRPALSFNGQDWQFAEETEFDGKKARLRLKVKAEGRRFWLARLPPYLNSHLDALLTQLSDRPDWSAATVATTPGKRPLRLLTITNVAIPPERKKVVWLMGRQHAWEAGSSWVIDGAIRFLLSDAEAARPLRDRLIVKIFPMCDPDGVARGGVRFNARGYDLNRNWDTATPGTTPEIYAQRKAILDWIDGGQRLDFFLTIHNTESTDYIQGPISKGGARAKAVIEKLADLLEEHTSFYAPKGPRDMQSSTTPGMKGRMSVNQYLFDARQVTALLMELMTERNPRLGRELTVEDRQEFGGQLVRLIAQALGTLDGE